MTTEIFEMEIEFLEGDAILQAPAKFEIDYGYEQPERHPDDFTASHREELTASATFISIQLGGFTIDRDIAVKVKCEAEIQKMELDAASDWIEHKKNEE